MGPASEYFFGWDCGRGATNSEVYFRLAQSVRNHAPFLSEEIAGLMRGSGDAVSCVGIEPQLALLDLGDGNSDVLHSSMQRCFAALPFAQSASIHTALMHAIAVELASCKVFRYVLDDLVFDPVPKAIQRPFAICHF
jgi:hypothetical protein